MARKRKEKVSQEEAEKMIENGEAEIPAESIVEKHGNEKSSAFEKDYEKHPKFSKFKGEG